MTTDSRQPGEREQRLLELADRIAYKLTAQNMLNVARYTAMPVISQELADSNVFAPPAIRGTGQGPATFEPLLTDLTHTRNCPMLNPMSDELCICGLEWRIRLRTEMEMHNAWRKRAEESEAALAAPAAAPRTNEAKLEHICESCGCGFMGPVHTCSSASAPPAKVDEPGVREEMYPGEDYFAQHNPRIKRADEAGRARVEGAPIPRERLQQLVAKWLLKPMEGTYCDCAEDLNALLAEGTPAP